MVNKKTIAGIGVVAGGVIIAGFIMAYFEDVEIIKQAKSGFGR